jgi:DNA-binding SARP family transcriptional activator/pimeloyl-ACP methyl ester carboxylesterase
MLSIQLLGELQVREGGAIVPLPPSRKTRALLAYLAAADRPQRRQRLCELFWELPDDPRGALRWSLSKLRVILDRPGAPVVAADRESAALNLAPDQVDLLAVRAVLKEGPDAAASETLEALARRFGGPFLADGDLPQSPEVQSWIVGMREEVRRLHVAVLTTLDDRHAANPERALPYARELVQLDPYSEAAWARLVERLNHLGRRREAEQQYEAARVALSETGGPSPVLERARRVQAPQSAPAQAAAPAPRQEIRFCRAHDGVRIAYALAGQGPPLVKAANWLNHLEYDWETPIWDHFFRGLASEFRLLRHDARGNGLSDRDIGALSLEAWVSDLEAVVEAAGYERFPLLGISQGCAISVAYALRNPERVSHLILYGGFSSGAFRRENNPEEREERRALITLMRLGWGQDNPAFRQIFTTSFMPEGTREQFDAFNELQRRTISAEGAALYFETVASLDVRDLLGQISVPTLVMHARGDALVPIERGRELAAAIPGARFVPLPGRNHLFLPGEPAAERFMEELRLFLAE